MSHIIYKSIRHDFEMKKLHVSISTTGIFTSNYKTSITTWSSKSNKRLTNRGNSSSAASDNGPKKSRPIPGARSNNGCNSDKLSAGALAYINRRIAHRAVTSHSGRRSIVGLSISGRVYVTLNRARAVRPHYSDCTKYVYQIGRDRIGRGLVRA